MTNLRDLLIELRFYLKKRANVEQIRDLCEIIIFEFKNENLRIARGAKHILSRTNNSGFNYFVAESEVNNMISVFDGLPRL